MCLRPVLVPWGEGFGIPNRSPDPLVRRAGQDHPCPVSADAPRRERDVARREGHGRPAVPGNKTTGIEPRLGQVSPRRSACGASVPPAHPLTVVRS